MHQQIKSLLTIKVRGDTPPLSKILLKNILFALNELIVQCGHKYCWIIQLEAPETPLGELIS